MNKFMLSTIALAVTIAGQAIAADIPVKAPVLKAVPIDPWTGFYIGANVGYSWGRWNTTSATAIFPSGAGLGTTASPNVRGWVGGFQAGINQRIDNTWIVGVEVDWQRTGERARSSGSAASARIPEFGNDFNDIFTTVATANWKFPWFATLRGRVGALMNPTSLLYLTGGLAIGEFKYSSQVTVTCQQFGPGPAGTIPTGAPCEPAAGTPALGTTSLSGKTTRTGWTIGGGLETKFSRNWSAKIEYLYLNFDRHTFFGSTASPSTIKLQDHILRLGLNYAFDTAR
jgi:outer membrane immunogenic protein